MILHLFGLLLAVGYAQAIAPHVCQDGQQLCDGGGLLQARAQERQEVPRHAPTSAAPSSSPANAGAAEVAPSGPAAHGATAARPGGQSGAAVCISGRAWPDVYLLGQQKAGTSTLAYELMRAGLSSAVGHTKELHMFDKLCNFSHDTEMTESLFYHGFVEDCPVVGAERVAGHARLRSCGESGRHSADMTPLNLRLPGLPRLLSHLYGESKGQLKFVVALRDPLARFHSGYYHARRWKTGSGLPVESFGAYVRLLGKSWPEMRSSGSVSRAYRADELYRSMYGKLLQPWLQAFPPSQFTILAMERYLGDLDARASALVQLEQHFEVGLNVQVPQTLSHVYANQHPPLEQDLDEEGREWLEREVFGPDRQLLAASLASGLEAGMLLLWYAGPPSASEILKFLNWGPY